jgi:predicted metal-binding membrane protein
VPGRHHPLIDGALVQVLRRDRFIVLAALAALTLLAWADLLWLAGPMAMAPARMSSGMEDMPGMDMSAMGDALAPAFKPWGPLDFAVIFAMWAVMMTGMMTPSVAPMILLYAGFGRKAAAGGAPFASAGWFFAGYLAVWVGFGALATAAQWALTSLALLTPAMVSASAAMGGGLLIAAGLYQWTPLKDRCLSACQVPLAFLMAHGGFRPERSGAFALGTKHGAYCLGCCFALMMLLFVGGVMNTLWIAGLTILVLLEKTVPAGRLIPRISGVAMIAAGLWLVFHA